MIRTIDISGEWGLFMDKSCSAVMPEPDDVINLPDTTSHAQKGEYNNNRETGYLTDTYAFEGNAWFSKNIPLEASQNKILLFLERTRITHLYVNSIEVGCQESLCSPHIYDVTSYIRNGINRFDICVSNVGYKTAGGHMTSPDTQTNWNGITGRIELQEYAINHLTNIMVFPDVKNKSFRITADSVVSCSGQAVISAKNEWHSIAPQMFEYCNGKLDAEYYLGENALLWDEHSPNLYELTIAVGNDVNVINVGLRDFKACGDKFTVNGRKTFLRGKHDGMIFPDTAFAPTDLQSWLKVMKAARSYGINHYRFHTCCPPEAAFVAADMLGIYMQPELPFWGTVTTKSDENHNEKEQQFLIAEGYRILQTFGNHPSFCMMSLGNELWGSKEKLNEILGAYKSFDNRHLYTQGSNNFQWCPCVLENDDFFVGVRLSKNRLLRGSYAMCDAPQGHVQIKKPSADNDYDNALLSNSSDKIDQNKVQIQFGTGVKTVNAENCDDNFYPEIPIITHEIGQYETYPNFNEIEKYKSSLKPENLKIFRERLAHNGMLSLADDFFQCSGKLSVQCYKQELEAVFRTRNIAGFQLLDIQDFSGQGTALVGILDAFMESKGLVSAKQWLGFCSEAVLTARFSSYIFEEEQTFSAEILLTYFGNDTVNGKNFHWKICDEQGTELFIGEEQIQAQSNENYIDICCVNATLPTCNRPKKLIFTLSCDSLKTANSYEIYVFPKTEHPDLSGYYVFDSMNKDAENALSEGKRILLARKPDSVKNSIEGTYCTDFWCYPMFRSISESMGKPEPVGTMGLLIRNTHPALELFPCEKFTTPQWWEIVTNSCSEILDDCSEDKNIIIQTIDNFERNHHLGLMYEYLHGNGQVVVLNCDTDKLAQSIEGKQFLKSVLNYIDKK